MSDELPIVDDFEDDLPVSPSGRVAVRAESGALRLGNNKVLEFCRCATPQPMTRADLDLGPLPDDPVIAQPCPENSRFKGEVGSGPRTL